MNNKNEIFILPDDLKKFYSFYKIILDFLTKTDNQLKLTELRKSNSLWQEHILRLIVLRNTIEKQGFRFEGDKNSNTFSYIFCSLILFLKEVEYEIPNQIKDDFDFLIQIDRLIFDLYLGKANFKSFNVSLFGLLFYVMENYQANIDEYIKLVLEYETSEYALKIQDLIMEARVFCYNFTPYGNNLVFAEDYEDKLLILHNEKVIKSFSFDILPRTYQN